MLWLCCAFPVIVLGPCLIFLRPYSPSLRLRPPPANIRAVPLHRPAQVVRVRLDTSLYTRASDSTEHESIPLPLIEVVYR